MAAVPAVGKDCFATWHFELQKHVSNSKHSIIIVIVSLVYMNFVVKRHDDWQDHVVTMCVSMIRSQAWKCHEHEWQVHEHDYEHVS